MKPEAPMKPRAFKLVCDRLFVRKGHTPLSARTRVVRALGVTPEQYDAWCRGDEIVPESVQKNLSKLTRLTYETRIRR